MSTNTIDDQTVEIREMEDHELTEERDRLQERLEVVKNEIHFRERTGQGQLP